MPSLTQEEVVLPYFLPPCPLSLSDLSRYSPPSRANMDKSRPPSMPPSHPPDSFAKSGLEKGKYLERVSMRLEVEVQDKSGWDTQSKTLLAFLIVDNLQKISIVRIIRRPDGSESENDDENEENREVLAAEDENRQVKPSVGDTNATDNSAWLRKSVCRGKEAMGISGIER
ncbi:hypothetical protein GYMLUDRAFT_238894 [Collybiopsis luxurians FD-317 M1]|nr:hypothetical protein GYMLUDRAFT_238894 [Collybiopsis luxurians FD-317 M1]